MATYEVSAKGAWIKVREPGIVALLHAVTLGIYNWFWYYEINRELRDYGEAVGDDELAKSNPGMSLLAVTLGWLLIVPPFLSWVNCTDRIRRMQALEGDETPISGWVLVGLYLFGFAGGIWWLGIPLYVQDALNTSWKKYAPADQAPGADAAASTARSAQPVPSPEEQLPNIVRED